jgi:hypothetical protein
MLFKGLKRTSQSALPTQDTHSVLDFKGALVINNPDKLKSVIGRETLVVCGAARGMTSLISFTLFELGYYIGTDLQSQNFEDQDFYAAIPPRARFRGLLTSRPKFRALVRNRNAAHQRWGFKLPRAADYVEELSETLRDPVFVLCVRNPLAIMRTIKRRNPHFKGSTPEFYKNGLGWLNAMGILMSSDSIPSIMVDMDDVRRDPETFLSDFTELLALNDVPEDLLERISRPGYKNSRRQPEVTFVGPRDKRDPQ